MLMSVLFESIAPLQTMTANYCLASAASRNDDSDVDQAANDIRFCMNNRQDWQRDVLGPYSCQGLLLPLSVSPRSPSGILH